MANQPEVATYDAGIYQWETTDPVVGGVGSVMNRPLLSLANRTAYLKARVDALGGALTYVTGSATLTAANAGVVTIDATSGNIVLTYPAANATGRPLFFEFSRLDASANTVTVQRAGSDVLNPGNQTSFQLAPFQSVVTASDGSAAWLLFSDSLLGKRQATFSGSGTWTVPTFVTAAQAIVTAGGGGGGGNDTTTGQSAGGGAAGGTAFKNVTGLVPGTNIPVTVGVGGTGGPPGSGGGNGSSSSFGSYCSATAGTGGGFVAGNSSPAGDPGSGVGGDLNLTGCYGTDGAVSGGLFGGQGGASFWGGAGRASANGVNGKPGVAPGAGGGAGYGTGTALSGGAGANGVVVVRY